MYLPTFLVQCMSINLRPCLISYQSINQSINHFRYSNIHIRIVCFIVLAMHKVQIDMYDKKGLACMYGSLQTPQFCYLVERILSHQVVID